MPKRRVKPRIERSAEDDQQCSSDEEDYFLDAVLGKAEVRLAGKGKDDKAQPGQGREDKEKDKPPNAAHKAKTPRSAASGSSSTTFGSRNLSFFVLLQLSG